MVGTWLLVWGKKDGVQVAPRLVTGWEAATRREVTALRANGTCSAIQYNATGGLVKQINGTWSSGSGKGTLHWTSGGITSPIPFTYTRQGANVATLAISVPGFNRSMTNVRLLALTGRDAALLKTWTATGVWVNGVAKPISYLTGTATYPKFARSFLASGTSQRYFLGLDENQEIKLPKPGAQNWLTGGGALQLGTGPISEGIYVATATQLTTWNLDASGNTLKVVFAPYGAAGAHDARVVGTWHPISGKIDGVAKPVAQVMNWKTGITSEKDIFRADGTYESSRYAGATLSKSELDRWYTASGRLYIDGIGPVASGTYAFGTGTMTCTFVMEGHTYLMVFKKDA